MQSFADLPLWAPLSEDRGFMQISNDKLHSLGFEFSPVEGTIQDCLKWFTQSHPNGIEFGVSSRPGLTFERERELLELWKAT